MKNPAIIQFILALVCLLLFVGGYAFSLTKVKGLSEESSELAMAIEEKSAARSGVSASRTALAELAQTEDSVRARFVSPGRVVPFLESLESLAASFGAEAHVAAVSDPDALGRIEVALAVSGPFQSVMKTLGTIEYGPYASATKNLVLDAGDEDLWRAALTFEVLTPETP